ncbi:MAG: flagellar biosynthesis chaperone FliJ [Bacteroidia bacterium]|jgi:flagellar biosynthesis chaperone FliJ
MNMESQNVLSEKIFLTTEKIQEEFPELIKYLDEIPSNFQSNTEQGVSKEALKEYLDYLNDLFETYAKEHKKVSNHK